MFLSLSVVSLCFSFPILFLLPGPCAFSFLLSLCFVYFVAVFGFHFAAFPPSVFCVNFGNFFFNTAPLLFSLTVVLVSCFWVHFSEQWLYPHCCVLKLRWNLKSNAHLCVWCQQLYSPAKTTSISHDHSLSHSTCLFKECLVSKS